MTYDAIVAVLMDGGWMRAEMIGNAWWFVLYTNRGEALDGLLLPQRGRLDREYNIEKFVVSPRGTFPDGSTNVLRCSYNCYRLRKVKHGSFHSDSGADGSIAEESQNVLRSANDVA